MKKLLPALLLLAAPAAFAADDISYTFAEVDYLLVEPDIDGFDVEGDDGLGLSGSLHVTDHFYLFGNYQTGEVDSGIFDDIDVDLFDLGLGWRMGLGPNLDVLAEAAWARAEVGQFDDNGAELKVGLRFAATDSIELGAKLGYADFGDNLDGGFGEFNLLWKFNRVLGVNVLADIGEDSETYGVGLRATF